MVFDNVRFQFRNASNGPDSGRAYTIDHTTDTLLVKTFPGGTLISTIPLDTNIQNEVKALQYDGYYFWSLSNLGALGNLGVVINKWLLVGSSLKKQTGAGNEVNLINTVSNVYDSEAMCIQTHETFLSNSVSAGATQCNLNDVTFLNIGDSIYLGPSTIITGERRERRVTGISGNTVFFAGQPLDIGFNLNNIVIYRKNIWLFNNRVGASIVGGSLIQINSYNGLTETTYTNGQWRNVTAATSNNGNISFVRGSQFLQYKPFGSNAGFQSSSMLLNIEVDNTTIIKVYSIYTDSTNIYKLQRKEHAFNNTTFLFEDTTSLTNNYEISTETLLPKVFSISAERSTFSILFKPAAIGQFKIKLRDQYNIPILGRTMSVTEDDASGFITAGFTSFVTNSLGEGLTQYNTGVSPTYREPTISVIDNITLQRLFLRVDQVPFVDGKSFVNQDGRASCTRPVEQRTLSSTSPIIQGQRAQGVSFLNQVVTSNSRPLIQDTFSSIGFVVQNPAVSGTAFITQDTAISDITTLEQFIFLIFALPIPFSVKNPVTTNILVRIIGFGATPLNSSTLVFKVNGVDITSDVVITLFGGGLQLEYNPPVDFEYSSTVSVFISIDDTDLPPRTVTTSYTFDVVGDFKNPFLLNVFPPDRSTGNLPMTEVYGIIKDLETGVNIDSIELYIEGKQVVPEITVIDIKTVKALFQTLEPYPYTSEISASIYAEDLEGNRFVGAWSFFIRPSSGVLFTNVDPELCDVLVPVDTNICAEVFGLEDGVNLNTLSMNVEGKDVIYLLNPKIYRKE